MTARLLLVLLAVGWTSVTAAAPSQHSAQNNPARQPTTAPSMNTTKPTVLLSVDNTWFHRLGLSRFTYQRALRNVGLVPLSITYDEPQAPAANDDNPSESLDYRHARAALENASGLVLAGGGDVDPSLYGEADSFSIGVRTARDSFELALLDVAQQRGLPVFAICRGLQLLNVSRGGSLLNVRDNPDIAPAHRRYRVGHPVNIEPESVLVDWLGQARIDSVTSFHGQAVDRLGTGLTVVGRAPDEVVEAIEDPSRRTAVNSFGVVGVQWHPEVRTDAAQLALFSAFADAARSYFESLRNTAEPSP